MFDLDEKFEEKDAPVIIRDPKQDAEMVAKLIALKREHIREAQHMISQSDRNSRSASTYGHAELSHRYSSSTFRDLKSPIEFYQQLKRVGL